MSFWKIQPQGVQAVLAKVRTQADDMDNDLSKQNFDEIGTALSSGATALLGEVPKAVNGLMTDQAKNFKIIGSHIRAGLAGVTDATIAYANAQTQMSDSMNKYNQAETFQAAMLSAADSGDMSYFQQHGYDKSGNLVTKPAAAPAAKPGE